MGIDRPNDGDPRLRSADAREAPAPDEVHQTGTDVPRERASQLEAHADLRAKADAAYRAEAIDQGCNRVRETEETVVTPAMRRIEAQDPNRSLVGLEFRLKGRERLSEKIATAVEERGRSITEAFGLVKDAIRFTFCYSEDRYTQGVLEDCDRLEAEGFKRLDRKNSWAEGEYKGINSRWRVPDGGQIFEVQFHTRASFEAKQETHWAYEQLRALPDDEAEVRQLHDYRNQLTPLRDNSKKSASGPLVDQVTGTGTFWVCCFPPKVPWFC